MSTSPISELIIPYDPEPLAEKVGRRRRLVRSRVISLVITIALLLLIYLWRREDMQGAVFVVIYRAGPGDVAGLACRQHRSLCAGQTGGKDTR